MLSNTGINRIILLGQITQDAITAENNGMKFLCFTLVTNEVIKKGSDFITHQEFHNIKVPGKLVAQENLLVKIGQTIYVEGKIQTTSFIDELRIKRYNLEIIAYKVEVLNLAPVTV